MKLPQEYTPNDLKDFCAALASGDAEAAADFWSRFGGLFKNTKDAMPSATEYPAWVYRLAGK